MRRVIGLVVFVGAMVSLTANAETPHLPTGSGPSQATVAVCFTPAEDCEAKIVEVIDGAESDIKVQAYGFSSDPILRSLRRAMKRGVSVELVLDKSDGFGKGKVPKLYNNAGLMAAAGAKVWIDDHSGIAHNKVIIIDDQLVVGGSFNYTKSAATRNRENVTFMQGPKLAAAYIDNWNSRRRVSFFFNDLLPVPARTNAASSDDLESLLPQVPPSSSPSPH